MPAEGSVGRLGHGAAENLVDCEKPVLVPSQVHHLKSLLTKALVCSDELSFCSFVAPKLVRASRVISHDTKIIKLIKRQQGDNLRNFILC